MWYIPTMAFMISKFGFEENHCSKTRKLLESVSVSVSKSMDLIASATVVQNSKAQQPSPALF